MTNRSIVRTVGTLAGIAILLGNTPASAQTATLEPPKTLGVLDLAHALRGKEAVQAIGQGQIHYFYRRGADVFWVAADPPVAREVIARLLRPEP